MSGTGYTDPSCVKTAVCSKCEGYKTWNYWYHTDESLCDDCYYIGGKYKDLTKEEAMELEKRLERTSMKLTETDKKQLIVEFSYQEKDLQQIERAMSKRYTTYEIDGEIVPLEQVLELMDRKEYLSGISRSAFHWSAVRNTKDGREICFDSSKLFK